MRDVNKSLRIAYTTALKDVISVPVYYNQAPNNQTGNYVVFRPISNTDTSTKSSSDVEASMQVNIYTESEEYNDGNDCDEITNEILEIIYPNPQAKISLNDNKVMFSTELVSDSTDGIRVNGVQAMVDRTLVFKHSILIN